MALSNQGVLRSEFFGWLVMGERRVGALKVYRYDPKRCRDNEDFIAIMDCENADEAALAIILSEFFENVRRDLTWAGPILDFRFAWIDQEFVASPPLGRVQDRQNGGVSEALNPHDAGNATGIS